MSDGFRVRRGFFGEGTTELLTNVAGFGLFCILGITGWKAYHWLRFGEELDTSVRRVLTLPSVSLKWAGVERILNYALDQSVGWWAFGLVVLAFGLMIVLDSGARSSIRR